MTDETDPIEQAALLLAGAELDRRAVAAIEPAPGDLATAYRIQDAGHRLHGEQLAAWKAGVTSEAAQELLELDAPVAGRVRASYVLESPGSIGVDAFATPPRLEVEVGLRLHVDLTEVPADPLELAEVVDAVPVIEVVSGRVASFPLLAAADLVADNVVSGRIVTGTSLGLDVAAIRALDSIAVALEIDREEVVVGRGSAALGHPLHVLGWLAQHAVERAAPLRSGELVITGTCTGMTPVQVGSTHVGRVGAGSVTLHVE
ncbi:MAG: 2-keto-4-pentenoate hydratase [Ilumatobacter sp.]